MDNTMTSKSVQLPGLGRLPVWIMVTVGLTLLTGGIVWYQGRIQRQHKQAQVMVSQAAFEEKTGVRIVRVALAAGDGMIDLRYQVIDPDKAVIIHESESTPAILDEASGTILNAPWMNHGHSGEYKAGVTYYTLLMNSGGVLSKGSEVTVILGGVSQEHIVVQ